MPHLEQRPGLLCPAPRSLAAGNTQSAPGAALPHPALGSKQSSLADNILWVSSLKAIYSDVINIPILYMGFSSLATGIRHGQKVLSCLHQHLSGTVAGERVSSRSSHLHVQDAEGWLPALQQKQKPVQGLPEINNPIVTFKGCMGSDKTLDSLLTPFILTSTTSPCKIFIIITLFTQTLKCSL